MRPSGTLKGPIGVLKGRLPIPLRRPAPFAALRAGLGEGRGQGVTVVVSAESTSPAFAKASAGYEGWMLMPISLIARSGRKHSISAPHL